MHAITVCLRMDIGYLKNQKYYTLCVFKITISRAISNYRAETTHLIILRCKKKKEKSQQYISNNNEICAKNIKSVSRNTDIELP